MSNIQDSSVVCSDSQHDIMKLYVLLVCYLCLLYILPITWLMKIVFAIPAIILTYLARTTPCEDHVDVDKKAVLITGCDTGIGHELTKRLDSFGFRVFAGCLFQDGPGACQLRQQCSENVKILQLDVTNEEQVATAFKKVQEQLQDSGENLWGLVNNAAVNGMGEVEWVSVEAFKTVAEVNLWGTLRVTKAFLPLLRKSKGRIVMMSSMCGLVSFPCTAPYSVSKYAIEAVSDALRCEMFKWGVNVCIIEPGNYAGATRFFQRSTVETFMKNVWESMSETVKQDYGREYFDTIVKHLCGFCETGSSDLSPVMKDLTDALTSISPRERYFPAPFSWKCIVSFFLYFPASITDIIFKVSSHWFNLGITIKHHNGQSQSNGKV